MDIAGARVLLTGASSGIGAALAVTLGARGARLVLAARREDRLREVGEAAVEAGATSAAVRTVDLARRGAADELAAFATFEFGAIDILINNAGGGVGGAIWAVGDTDAIRDAYEVNFWSPLALIAAVVPEMRSRREGTVVNVTSAAPGMVWPGFGGYASTKAALSVATDALRTEVRDAGLTVIEVIPGPVDTAVQGETRLLPGIERMLDLTPLGDPETLARLVADAIVQPVPRLFYPHEVRRFVERPLHARDEIAVLAEEAGRELGPETLEMILSGVVRTGSSGDPMLVRARDDWENSRRDRAAAD